MPLRAGRSWRFLCSTEELTDLAMSACTPDRLMVLCDHGEAASAPCTAVREIGRGHRRRVTTAAPAERHVFATNPVPVADGPVAGRRAHDRRAAVHRWRFDVVGIVRGRLRLDDSGRAQRDALYRSGRRVQPVSAELAIAEADVRDAVQHGDARRDRAGRGFRLHADASARQQPVRRPPRGRSSAPRWPTFSSTRSLLREPSRCRPGNPRSPSGKPTFSGRLRIISSPPVRQGLPPGRCRTSDSGPCR